MTKTRNAGSVIVLVAVTLAAIIFFAGLVVDVGFWYTRRSQTQANADVAILSALGQVDTTLSLAEQQNQLRTRCRGILAANGYDPDLWSVTPVSDPTGQYVVGATVLTTQALPTFFLAAVTPIRPQLRTQAVADGVLKKSKLPPCGIVATGVASYLGGGVGVIDSYHSGEAGYSPTHLESGRAYDRVNAQVCANSLSYTGNIAQFGSIYDHADANFSGGSMIIDGDVVAGGTITVADSVVSGDVLPHSEVPHFTLPAPGVPADIATVNDNASIQIQRNASYDSFSGTVLQVGGGAIIHLVPGRDYYFTAVQLTGGATIVIDGTLSDIRNAGRPTRIFANGDFSAAGGIQFLSSLLAAGADLGGVTARDLEIIGMASTGSIDIGGGSKILADIYAPQMDVRLLGGGHTFGRIRANDIRIDGTANFTFDEALGYDGADTDTYSVRPHLIR